MADNTEPDFSSFLQDYLQQRKQEYKTLYKCWVSGATNCHYPPTTWPADQCLLTRLPAELLVLIFQHLYQADLFHLSLTCRALTEYPIHLLYSRDVAHFDCLALRWACTFGTVATLQRTLSYGACANHVFLRDSEAECSWVLGAPDDAWICDTPLKTAVLAAEPEIIRLLCAHGADVNFKDDSKVNAEARWWEYLYPINFAFGSPDMPAISGIQYGNPQVVRSLLDAGADPNQHTIPRPHRTVRDRDRVEGATPLMMAMQTRVPVETVKLLLERGADPSHIGTYRGFFMRNNLGPSRRSPLRDRSPLSSVLYYSVVSKAWPLDLEKIQLLIDYGAHDELAILGTSYTSHPHPVIYRHWNHLQIVQVLQMLIAAGADLASWAARGMSPILSVIWWAERFISKTWDSGAAQKVSNAISKTSELITLMAEATLAKKAPTPRSTIIDHVPLPSMFNLPIHKKDQTPLRYVCGPFRFVGATTLAPLLLHYGADINSADKAGRTALHHAAMYTSGERVRTLVNHIGTPASTGLVVDARDAGGWTPLHYACLFGFWSEAIGQVGTAQLLLDNGADVRARTKSGWTPLSLAVFSGNPHAVKLLLDCGAQLDDLYFGSPGCGEQHEPAIVPVGRFLLFFGVLNLLEYLEQLTVELEKSKTLIARLLETRLGIASSVVLSRKAAAPSGSPRGPEPEASPSAPPEHTVPTLNERYERLADILKPRPLEVQALRGPFGVSYIEFNQLTTKIFDSSINNVLVHLGRYDLDAWIAMLSDPPAEETIWHGLRPSDQHENWPWVVGL